ncbi:MAG: PucR family transcriptional regulator ligand-binding domain-containing protein [Thermaerobacter sp.]|nr:PucR family transcriptional regulator ligand-binding domain-containing protein [Thermaerobacter sp.]
MAMTVSEFLNLEIMRSVRVLAGRGGMSRLVDWVSVIEVPVEDFVRDGEFVLTTGVGCGHDPVLFRSFVADIMESGASGLAVAVGRHVFKIPADIMRIADQAHFPLVEIPWDVRFSDVSRQVLESLIHGPATPGARPGHPWTVDLLNQVAEGVPLARLLAAMAEHWRMDLVVVDGRQRVCAQSAENSPWFDGHRQSLLNRWLGPGPATMAAHQQIGWMRVDDYPVAAVSLESPGRSFGTLVARGKEAEGAPDQTSLEMMACMLVMWFLHDVARQEAEDRVHDDFVWSLAKGEMTSWDQLKERSQAVACDITEEYVCAIGRLENAEALFRQSQSVFTNWPRDRWQMEIIATAREALREMALQAGCHAISTFQHGEFVVYLFSPKRPLAAVVERVLYGLRAGLRDKWPKSLVSWGVAGEEPGVAGFHASFTNARAALEIGDRQLLPGHLTWFERVANQKAIQRLSRDRDMRELVEATIGALVEYDRDRGADLVHTLAIYLFNRTNVSQTSRALNLHRQSLLYRLRKIEAITSRSLDSPDDLFLLELCMRIIGATQGASDH